MCIITCWFVQVQCQEHAVTIVSLERKLITSLEEATHLRTEYERFKLRAADLEQEKCEYCR